MYCSKCGKQITDGSHFCPECGAQLGASTQPPPYQPNTATGTRDQEKRSDYVYPKNPPLSPHFAWLHFALAGLPCWLHGQVAKGFVFLISSIVATIIIPGIGWIFVDIVATIDSYKVGKKLAAGQPVRKWEWFPSV